MGRMAALGAGLGLGLSLTRMIFGGKNAPAQPS